MEDKKVVLVTGARSGIGRAVSEVLARAGHCVYAGLRSLADVAKADWIGQFVERAGIDLQPIEMNVWKGATFPLLLGLIMVSPIAAPAAEMQIATYIEVAPAEAGRAAALVEQIAAASRAAQGLLSAVALQEEARPARFVLLERWRDPAARDAVGGRKPLLSELAPLLLAPPDERRHDALTLTAAGAPPPKDALWVVIHVDVMPPYQDQATKLLERWADASRAEPGNRRFDVLRQAGRPNHFTVIEAWDDAAIFTAHALGAPTRRWRAALAPMLGALYDQRLYRALG
jgi:quinol monooxygenase YgiN